MDDKELFEHWDQVRTGLNQALDPLRDEQLAFTPREGLWSLGQVACHIAGCEEGWLRDLCFGRWSRPEADYKLQGYPTVAALKQLLAEVHARTAAELATAPELTGRLDQPATLPWGPTVSWRWAVWHVLEHEIHHRGEIYLMLGLLGMEAPDV